MLIARSVHPLPGEAERKERLLALIDGFGSRRVLIVGDLIADEFIYGEVARVSREAPVLILRYDATEMVAGGAGNAANNVAALGGRARLAGLVGEKVGGQASPSAAQFPAAMRDTPVAELQATYQAVVDSLAHVRSIDAFLTQTVGASKAPDMGALLVMAFLICLVVLIPLLALKLLFQLVLGILFLPFRLLGVVLNAVDASAPDYYYSYRYYPYSYGYGPQEALEMNQDELPAHVPARPSDLDDSDKL